MIIEDDAKVFLPIPVASEIIWGKYNCINRKTFL